jgi:hypothetical protein
MADLEDMTHEELAAYAQRKAAQRKDPALADLARKLQAACDDERPSLAIAESAIDAIRWGDHG